MPAGTAAVSGETIASADYNSRMSDIEADLNAVRPIVAGGTGGGTAPAARTALGLAIGTDVQAYDAGLASIAGLTTAANKMVYTTGSDTYAVTDLTAFGRSLIDDADAAAGRTTLGLGNMATKDEGTAGAEFRDNAANDARFVLESGDTMSGALNMGGNNVDNVNRVRWTTSPDGGDWIEWETGVGLKGYENGGNIWVIGGSQTTIQSVGSSTTANAANCHVNSGGGMFRSTSTGAVKANVETVTDPSAIDSLRPVTFTSILPGDDPEAVFMGFIAEEVAEALPEAAMDKNYDQRALIALLVAAVKDLRARVTALEAA